MSRTLLMALVGALIVGVAVLGYLYYQESQSGVQIEIGADGVKIEGN